MKKIEKRFILQLLPSVLLLLIIVGGIYVYNNKDLVIKKSPIQSINSGMFKYSGITDDGKRFAVQYPSSWVYFKFSCNIDGVAFWPKNIAPNFSAGGICGMQSFLNSAPIEIIVISSKPSLYLANKDFEDVFKQMSDSLVVY